MFSILFMEYSGKNILEFIHFSCCIGLLKLHMHLTNVGPNKSERVWANARRCAFATAVRAFPLTSTSYKRTQIAYICSSFIRNFL